MVHLEVGVLVHLPSREPWNLRHARDINVWVGKQEQIDGAAGGNALLAKLGVEAGLRAEKGLKTTSTHCKPAW